jgi:small-conductance mechanosensitive channel
MEFFNRTLFTWNAEPVTWLRLLWAVAAFVLVMVIAHFLSEYLRRRMFARGHGNPPTERSVMRICRALAVLVGLLLSLSVIGFGLTGTLWFLGFSAIALVLVARGALANYAAGFVLLYERPITVGDHVQIGAEKGEVEAIRLRVTHLRTPGNTRLIIPNDLLMQEAITNLSAPDGRIRLSIGVQVAHGSDFNDVIMALRKVAERNPRVRKNPAPRSLVTGLVPDGLQFELWAWIGDPADAPWVENELYRGIDSELQRLHIRMSGVPLAPPPARARHSAWAEAAPAAVEPEPGVRIVEAPGQRESLPKRSRSRAKTRPGNEPAPAPVPALAPALKTDSAVHKKSDRLELPEAEFTLLEQPELSFGSEAEFAPPPPASRMPEPPARTVPEMAAIEPPATMPPNGLARTPEVPSAVEAAPSQTTAPPTFGRSKRKTPRR